VHTHARRTSGRHQLAPAANQILSTGDSERSRPNREIEALCATHCLAARLAIGRL